MVKESYTSTKPILKNREPNSEQFGEKYANLMETKELLLPDSLQIYQPEPWDPLSEFNCILKEIDNYLYFIIFIIFLMKKKLKEPQFQQSFS